MARFIAVLALGCVFAAGSSLAADEAALEQSYGNGVHAYFSGDHAAALSQFNEAIDGGYKDARVFFFRGLTQMRMGNDKEAQADFQAAAALETANPDRSSTISKSLQRVQGQTRLKIEQYRTRARMAALQQQRAKDDARFGNERANQRKAVEKQATDAAKAKDADLFDDAKKPEDVTPEKTDEGAEEGKAAEKKPADKADEGEAKKDDAVDDPFKDEAEMKKEDAKPAAKSDKATEEKPADATEEKPADATEEKPADAAEEKPAEKADEKPAEKADEKADE